MRPTFLLIALSCLMWTLPHAYAQQNTDRTTHFVDFRSRPGALWGHTFIVYGRVDERGRLLELHRAGLYPDDGRAGLILGTFVPVPATVQAVPDDVSITPNAIYRRQLSARDYTRLKAAVRQMRANERAWHMLMFNCNDFGIAVAQHLGLATPPNLLVPNAWVRALKAMNGG